MAQPDTESNLYNYSLDINNSINSNETTTLMYYHPNVWTFNGFPHDPYAVYFIKKNVELSFFVQIIFIAFAIVFSIIGLMVLHIQWQGGMEKVNEKHVKEYGEILKKIER